MLMNHSTLQILVLNVLHPFQDKDVEFKGNQHMLEILDLYVLPLQQIKWDVEILQHHSVQQTVVLFVIQQGLEIQLLHRKE